MWARAIAMWAFRQQGYSYTQLSQLFGKSRETIRSNYLRCLLTGYRKLKAIQLRELQTNARNDRLRASNRPLELDDPDILWIRSYTVPDVHL